MSAWPHAVDLAWVLYISYGCCGSGLVIVGQLCVCCFGAELFSTDFPGWYPTLYTVVCMYESLVAPFFLTRSLPAQSSMPPSACRQHGTQYTLTACLTGSPAAAAAVAAASADSGTCRGPAWGLYMQAAAAAGMQLGSMSSSYSSMCREAVQSSSRGRPSMMKNSLRSSALHVAPSDDSTSDSGAGQEESGDAGPSSPTGSSCPGAAHGAGV
mmetsp:Transcript_10307/g.22133  ORF Transcript_10307/g.22133 Transcript_10307/m.22133 type:complete len:212 (-) Transcript_10307:805-1440(-)